MRIYLWLHRRSGLRLTGTPRYIAPTCWLDGSDYSLIEIGHEVVISSNVRLLTHDYSITRALRAIGEPVPREVANVRRIQIGDNCFIGTGAILLPGTTLGSNCIVAAGSVVKGCHPDGVIIAGNPAQEIGLTSEYAYKHLPRYQHGAFRPD